MARFVSGIAAEVPATHVHPTAQVLGQTLIEGAHTRIGAGAHIENSYVCNAVVEPGAWLVDSVLMGALEGPRRHARPGFAARWAIHQPSPAVVGAAARIVRATIRDSSIGAGSRCTDAFVGDSTIGPGNELTEVYATGVESGAHVRARGPTELSEAWLGHHAVIDACGYFEGVFSNDFYVLEFDAGSGRLAVREVLDVPHVSRYGMNTINSTNSGSLLDQPGGLLASLGRHRGLWQDCLLSHEPMILGPCCWVAGWTKVIGKSAAVHASAAELLGDTLATHLLPFSVAGLDGPSVSGLVLPGERHDGPAPRRRQPAWVFTYAPGAVIAAVQRVAGALGDCALADRLPVLALRSALALVQAQAAARGVRLEVAGSRAHGWAGWLAQARRLLCAHLEAGLWEFSGGEPVAWRRRESRWVPAAPDRLAAIAADALAAQVDEAALTACSMPPLARTLGATSQELEPTRQPTWIDPRASVAADAVIGPGVQIRGASRIGSGARLCHAVVDETTVGAGGQVVRSALRRSCVGDGAAVTSCLLEQAQVAARSTADCARVVRASLRGAARLNPYALIEDAHLEFPCIVGSSIRGARIRSTFMSYHMPGQVEGLVVEPTCVSVDGQRVAVAAVPMLGGGLRVQGDAERPVTMECAFIGSNAILEAGARVGFGCFVLGRLTGVEGLPPFTVSVAAGPEADGIGMVVHQFANMVITHFINWAYQALGPAQAEAVGLLVPTMLAEGRAAVAWALAQRAAGRRWPADAPFAKYRSLALYSEAQLAAGLDAYERALADDRWQMRFVDGELRFTGHGRWEAAAGAARWRPAAPGQ